MKFENMTFPRIILFFVGYFLFISYTSEYRGDFERKMSEIAYCTPSVTPWNDYITNFSFGSISNPSSKTPHDFTSLTTDISQGQNYPVNINYRIKDWTSGGAPIHIKMWIDFNGDEVFQEASESVWSDTQALNPGDNVYTASGSVNIPASANTGSTRLRVFLRRGTAPGPCDNTQGEYEDYTVNILGGSDTTSPIPTITTDNDPVFGLFQVNIDFDESISGLSLSDFTVNNGTISNLSGSGTNYSADVNPASIGNVQITLPVDKVTDSAGNGNVSATLQVSYQTCPDDDGDGVCNADDVCAGGPEPGTLCDDGDSNTSNDIIDANCNCIGTSTPTSSCTPTVTPWNDYITNVSFGTINNTTSKTPNDYTSISTDVSKGQSYPISISYTVRDWTSNGLNINIKMWIDFNGDGIFQEATEVVFTDTKALISGANDYISNGTVNIPTGAITGSTELRIFLRRGQVPGPCDTGVQGDYEDYSVNILGGNDTTSPIPTLMTANNVVSGPFEFYTLFDEPITGLELSDFEINNGTISDLTGSGSSYTAIVTPIVSGFVSMSLPADKVIDGAGNGNIPSTTGVTYQPCPDDDGDGVCNADDVCPNGPEPGTLCDDGNAATFNDVIGVNCICAGTSLPNANETICLRIDNGIDDIREQNQGWVQTNGNDLRIGEHQIGLRFNNITIPNGSNILSADIQFKAFQNNTESVNLTITGQLVGDAPEFLNNRYELSNRDIRTASISWSPPIWNNGDLTDAQKTVDISSIIEELVSQSDFVSGNSIVIFIEGNGPGGRVAEAFEESSLNAAELCINYGGGSATPSVDTRTYTKLKKELDGSYVQLECSEINFQYVEDYAITAGENAMIECKLYNWQREAIFTTSLVNEYGVNWQNLVVSSGANDPVPNLTSDTYYTLEVTGANKGEKYKLRVRTGDVLCPNPPAN